jgi:glycosyltransferase involved in cell wall biosynthesis
VLLIHRENSAEAPFAADSVTAGLRSQTWDGEPDVATITRELDDFEPDAVLICSWDVGGYRQIGRSLRGKTLRVLTMDNQWWGTPKQWAGVAASRFVIQPAYDAVFLPADRQAAFARRLGFDGQEIIWGLNTCDYPKFAAVADERGDGLPPRSFLFAGRLVADKAIDVLADAYAEYRRAVTDPWPLIVAGAGPERSRLEGRGGVEMAGFVQPADLPSVYARAGCLVVPSRFEPWALVIHEAAAAGLPVVSTSACGATSRLVLDGYNGFVIPPNDRGVLSAAMLRIHDTADEDRRTMGEASRSLARQFTPERWARTLLDRVPELRSRAGLERAPWVDQPLEGAGA